MSVDEQEVNDPDLSANMEEAGVVDEEEQEGDEVGFPVPCW